MLRGVSSCHAITVAEVQLHSLNRCVVPGGEPPRGCGSAVQRSSTARIKLPRPALGFPPRTGALMSPGSRNMRDYYLGASCAGKTLSAALAWRAARE